MRTEEGGGDSFVCVVCGEAVEGTMSAECNWCDGRYHLNQRNDVEAKDCGQVWIDEQYMALQFACGNCLSGESRRPETQPKTRTPSTRPRRYRRRA
jgi:hypothetical protein